MASKWFNSLDTDSSSITAQSGHLVWRCQFLKSLSAIWFFIQINLIILCWSSWKESPKLLLPPIGIPIFISSSWPLAVLFGDWDEGIESSLMANSLRPPANTEFPPFAAIPLLFAPFKSVGPVTYKRTIKCGLVFICCRVYLYSWLVVHHVFSYAVMYLWHSDKM